MTLLLSHWTLLLSHWTFLGAVLSLWFTLQMACANPTQPGVRLYGTGLLLALTGLQTYYWLCINDLTAVWPFLHFLQLPLLYALGPLFYFYAESLQGQAPGDEHSRPHLIPIALLAVAALWQWWWYVPGEPLTLSTWLYALSFGSGATYAALVARKLHNFAHPASLILTQLVILRATVLMGIGVVLLVLLGSLLQLDWFIPLHASAISGLMVAIFLLQQRYPDASAQLAEDIAIEAEQRHKPRPQLTAINVTDTLQRLRNLMEVDHRYADETLDLPSLAILLDVSTHQLSQLINEQLGMNYTRYLKTHRVAAAKRLLLQSPDETVLNVALQTGFNSLSSFHAAFKELEGTTPGAYRKRHREPN